MGEREEYGRVRYNEGIEDGFGKAMLEFSDKLGVEPLKKLDDCRSLYEIVDAGLSQMRERCAVVAEENDLAWTVGHFGVVASIIRALPLHEPPGGIVCEGCGMPVVECICDGEEEDE